MKNMKKLVLLISLSDWKRLAAIKRESGRSVTDQIRQAVQEYLDKQEVRR